MKHLLVPLLLLPTVAAADAIEDHCQPHNYDCEKCPLVPKQSFCVPAVPTSCQVGTYDCSCPLEPKQPFCPGAIQPEAAPPLYGCEKPGFGDCCDMVSNPSPPSHCRELFPPAPDTGITAMFPAPNQPHVEAVLMGSKSEAVQNWVACGQHLEAVIASEAAAWSEVARWQRAYTNVRRELQKHLVK